MPCSRTQQGAASGDRTQDLSIQSLVFFYKATALPSNHSLTDVGIEINMKNILFPQKAVVAQRVCKN